MPICNNAYKQQLCSIFNVSNHSSSNRSSTNCGQHCKVSGKMSVWPVHTFVSGLLIPADSR